MIGPIIILSVAAWYIVSIINWEYIFLSKEDKKSWKPDPKDDLPHC